MTVVFWIIMLLAVLLIPGMMLFFGLVFLKRPPKKINCVFGYRTELSMKNADTWAFAHKKCGEIWTRWGAWLLIPSVLPMLLLIGRDTNTVAVGSLILLCVQMVPFIGSLIPVEKALRETFHKDGSRKTQA